MCVDRLFGDRQAETKSTLAIVEAHEWRERLFDLAGREPAAAIFDFNHCTPLRNVPAQTQDEASWHNRGKLAGSAQVAEALSSAVVATHFVA